MGRGKFGTEVLARIAAIAALLSSAGLPAQPANPSTGSGMQSGAGNTTQYDPNYEPRMDPNSDQFNQNYDPRTDPDHPSKQQEDPGEAWDLPRRGDGTPSILRAKGDWEWGELYYGQTYKTKLTITNECESEETVSVTVVDLPYLSVPDQVTVPGKSQKEVDIEITTPPEPNIPILTGHESLPPYGIFVDIDGDSEALKIWHPWNPPCLPKRETYAVTGHIHYPPDSASPSGPRKIAAATACEVYWNTGQRPARLEGDCTEELRVLALHYRERILQGYADRDPVAWGWLPGSAQIRGMDAAALLAMKKRADSQMREADR